MEKSLNEEKIAEILLGSDNIIISAHTGPDGDAIGSVSALLIALRKLGKNVRAVIEALPYKYSEIDGAGLIEFELEEGCRFKTFIALDCGDKARLGKFAEYFDNAEKTINIDHHSSNDYFGTYNLVDEHASATAELIYKILISDPRFEIDAQIASALYAGIVYDTGGFRHAHTSGDTYRIAGELITQGADFSRIYNKLFHSARFEEIKVLKTAFDNMKRDFDGRLVWTSITSAELSRANARPSDLDNVVDYCKSVEGSDIAAFIYQKAENEFKISLRSEPRYDISKIAVKLGGGGHRNAAGATYQGTFEQCAKRLIAEIRDMLWTE